MDLKANEHLGIRVYHADLMQAQADPALARLLGRSDSSAPFKRLDWLALLAQECFAAEHCFLAVARDETRIVALPLRETAWGFEQLGNWYSFFVGTAGSTDSDLLRALVASLGRPVRLAPLPEADAAALARAFRAEGWCGDIIQSDINHFMTISENGYHDWWNARPGALRETVRRKGRGDALALTITTTFSDADWAEYEAVYNLSWKPGEGSPAFLRGFAQAEGARGALRLGIAHADGVPVAAQFWTVEGKTAWIHKLAHDERAKALSPGTLLSHAMFRHVITVDGVETIDFGTGDDPYKQDWMTASRPRYMIEFHRPSSLRSWPRLLRMGLRRVLRRPLVSAAPAG